MPTSFSALTVLLTLLPGFLTSGVVRALCTRPKQSAPEKLIEALLYSFVIYVVFSSAGGAVSFELLGDPKASLDTAYSFRPKPIPLLWLTFISFALAVIVSYCITNDLPTRWLRRVHITQRTSLMSVWSDVFHALGGFVQVELSDGRQLLGWLRYYSDRPEDLSLFLEEASWVADEQLVPIPGPGVLLTKEIGIKYVMFLDPKRERPLLTVR